MPKIYFQCPECKTPFSTRAKSTEKPQVKCGDMVEGDDLFMHATLPEGWEKRPTDHHMYSDLLDAQGRKRASIMYKAAFYDRDASIHAVPRFQASYKNARWEDPEAKDQDIPVIEDSNGNVLWRGKPLEKSSGWTDDLPENYKHDGSTLDDRYYYSSHDHARQIACKVLIKVCPEYDSEDRSRMAMVCWDREPEWPKSESRAPKGELYSVYIDLWDYGDYGYDHVDGGLNCKVRATKTESAWKKAVKATDHFRERYDKVVLSIRLNVEIKRSDEFTKPIRIGNFGRKPPPPYLDGNLYFDQ